MTDPSGAKVASLQSGDEESQATKSTSGRMERHHRNRSSSRRRSSRHGSKTHQHDTGARTDEPGSGQPRIQASSSTTNVTDHVATDSPDRTAHGRVRDVADSDAGFNPQTSTAPGSGLAPKGYSRPLIHLSPETTPPASAAHHSGSSAQSGPSGPSSPTSDPHSLPTGAGNPAVPSTDRAGVDAAQTPGNWTTTTRDLGRSSCTDISQVPMTTNALCVDNALPSPNAVWDFNKTPGSKLEQVVSSPSTMRTSNPSPMQRGLVRFGGATLREFIPLTTLTEKISHSPAFYGSFGALAALAVVALAVMLLSTDPKRRQNDECGSDECRDAYGYLDSLLDSAIDPCTDFYRHVCRRWHIGNLDGATLAKVAAREVIDALHKTLLDKVSLSQHQEGDEVSADAEVLLARFHVACTSFIIASAHKDAAQRLVRAYQSDSEVLKLRNTTEALRRVVQLSLQRGISTLFAVRLIQRRDGEVALYVTQGQTLAQKLADSGHSLALMEFFKETLEEATIIDGAGISKSEVNATVLELLKYDEQTTLSEEDLPTAQTVNASHFAVILDEADPLIWLQFVNSVLSGATIINEQTPVMCEELGLVRAAVDLLAKNRRIGLIYIFFHIVMEVGRFYYRNKFLYDKPEEAELVCFTASKDIMGPGWLGVFLNMTRVLLPANSSAWRIFASVRSLSSDRPLDAGLDGEGKGSVGSALDDVTLIEKYAYSTALRTTVTNVSVATEVPHDTDFASYYTSLKALEAVRRLQNPPSLVEVLVGESLFADETIYSRLLNAALLPPAMQRPPLLYSTKVPLEFGMGTVGVLLSKVVFEAGLPSASVGESWYKINVKGFVDCVQRYAMNTSVVNVTDLSVRDGLDLYAWARAVSIAHGVMKNLYTRNGPERGLEDIWATAQRTFFRRYCLMTCSAENAGHESRLRCLVPLLNMVEFATAFQCSIPGLMKPWPCSLFLGTTS
ncbi:hypothetical protein HPB50_001071 [Hyalomma asiaticum]|uniref:Uncharacterized protein n=1 Tax=Hyalomma asiaticum TaxID=266040 RepID=A0ACB7RKK0_HYAAI|nr:hypothetical protein HPB50_001071 [Hyalomma asiaticum]